MASLDTFTHSRGRGASPNHRGRPLSRNKQWVANPNPTSEVQGSSSESWERGGHHGGRGRGRGRGRVSPRGRGRGTFPNATLRNTNIRKSTSKSPPKRNEQLAPASIDPATGFHGLPIIFEPEFSTKEELENYYQELVVAREQERKRAIAEGKMDDPLVQKRLEDAITLVGTCPDMCPRFERYRRERESNLAEWETIPGTKRIDHQRAVKMYERGAGDKSLPSDVRPPHVLKKTLDYLFQDLLPRGGLERTAYFIRDRSRAVRNDFSLQHLTGPEAIEAHDRCVRFHILVIHFQRNAKGFSMQLEEQQLMNSLQSLKEFYEDQRGKYQSPTELEMRVYHRLIHMRDQVERPENIPDHIKQHPVFKYVTQFRRHVQKKSEPITKKSPLIVDDKAMDIFRQLVEVLRGEGNTVMIYLVACILEWLFGPETIDDIESIRGDLSLSDIIDGKSQTAEIQEVTSDVDFDSQMEDYTQDEEQEADVEPAPLLFPNVPTSAPAPSQPQPSVFGSSFTVPPSNQPIAPPPIPSQQNAFASLVAQPNVFGTTFGAPAPKSAFPAVPSVFGSLQSSTQSTSASTTSRSAPTPSVFGGSVFSTSKPAVVETALKASAPSNPTPPASVFSSTSPFAQPPPYGEPLPNVVFPSVASPAPISPQPPPLPQAPPVATATNEASSTTKPLPPSSPSTFLNPKATPFQPGLFNKQPRPKSPTTAPAEPQESVTSIAATAPAVTRANLSSSSSRTATPPPLKIDVDLKTPAPPPTQPALSSPIHPPPPPKFQPISLPSTPTSGAPPSAVPLHLKGHLSTPFASGPSSNTGPLSPLFVQQSSPFALSTASSSTSSSPLCSYPMPGAPVLARGTDIEAGWACLNEMGKGKEKEKEREPEPPQQQQQPQPKRPPERREPSSKDLAAMEGQALSFARRSQVVKSAFQVWSRKNAEKAAYLRAIKQADEYQERIRLERSLNGSARGGAGTPDRKRRMSESVTSEGGDTSMLSVSQLERRGGQSPQRKRARKRISSVYQERRTDDELFKRFKENHEDHQKRWAPGTFLSLLKAYVKETVRLENMPSTWQIWVSVNPEVSDGTAIWVERKFNIPESGEWLEDVAFTIPVTKTSSPSGEAHPGLVVFECTPIEGVDDEIERKYRVLDDCTRLRGIVDKFPSDRYYTPALLTFCWTSNPDSYSAPDLFEMIDKLVKEGRIKSHVSIPMNSNDKDADGQFKAALEKLDMDLEGELVKPLNMKGVLKHYLPTLNSFIDEWVGSCANGDHFNWKLYNLVVHAIVELLNTLGQQISVLCGLQADDFALPEYDDGAIDDSDSAYEVAEEWLTNISSKKDVSHIFNDLASHRNIEQDFPTRIFMEHLVQLWTELVFQASGDHPSSLSSSLNSSVAGHPATIYYVLAEDLETSFQEFEETFQPWRIKLSQRLNVTARREPKRSHSMGSNTSATASPELKRPRLSTPSINGDYSPFSSPMLNGNGNASLNSGSIGVEEPSPSPSLVSLPLSERTESVSGQSHGQVQKPKYTAASLRALTEDMRRKFMRTR
ncbi:nuclear pore-associated protein [Coprinopsis cinerea okayama7|uniref:Nuclear pore-associated protein n=1 Tax=Coprinopsis cinerea (strain Okayama-7 / 130 / ATCC MYA-4618 / FGSC 9003) TaxID=240176 RepID=D6RQZ0_COPC7|nr:nuclear pore-associated protein [Coprinopsis cinerea okayama7\|eukprot:XP_002910067.1 nuclear pore-associated protein [Coprinopsis cinerea okayama7\